MNKGPIAYAKTKMDSVRVASTSFVIWNSALIDGRAGEIIEDEIGERSVKEETMNVAAHLRLIDQFFGFAGSSTESQVT